MKFTTKSLGNDSALCTGSQSIRQFPKEMSSRDWHREEVVSASMFAAASLRSGDLLRRRLAAAPRGTPH